MAEILHPIQSNKHTGERDFRPNATSKSAFQQELERQRSLELQAQQDAERDAAEVEQEEPKTAFEAEMRAGRRPFSATVHVEHLPDQPELFEFPPSKTEGTVAAAKENHPATSKSSSSLQPPSISSNENDGKKEPSA